MLPMLINKYIAKPFVRNRYDREITKTQQTDNRGRLVQTGYYPQTKQIEDKGREVENSNFS